MALHDDTSNSNDLKLRPAALELDPEDYRSELDRFDLTEAQKLELLTTLWSIMRSFVELGFAVDICATVFDDAAIFPADDEMH